MVLQPPRRLLRYTTNCEIASKLYLSDGKVKGKRGKNARRARQGRLGVILPGKPSKKQEKQFTKKQRQRDEKRDDRRELDQLKEDVREKLSGKEDAKKPYSFVIHTGRVGKYVKRLERDIRRLMEPNTSADLKVTKKNNFKDFLVNSQALGVSHLVVLTKTENSTNLRIIRNSQGPTLHFKVQNYSLARDVLSSQKRPVIFEEQFQTSPLVILTGFNQPGKKHLNLVQTVIQNMFPSIDVDTLKLKNIRRALLASYDPENDIVEIRHYALKAVPSVSDFSEYMLNPGVLSDSEFEGEQVELDLPQDVSNRGLMKGQKTKIRLIEIGPRMSWKLMKIEEGINSGEVLYHSHIEKSAKEIAELRKNAPRIKKKQMLHEKKVEHAVIRKLRAFANKQVRAEEDFNAEKSKLIEKQAQVTGEIIQEKEPPVKMEEKKQNFKPKEIKMSDFEQIDLDGNAKKLKFYTIEKKLGWSLMQRRPSQSIPPASATMLIEVCSQMDGTGRAAQ
uniref:Brix domain-containing protein n=1 Tax=Ditylenchus dipsaci TaxID=166011 RepID=A0A915DEN7_9BILA